MISFIVIGRNEGWKLTQCFNSILKAVQYIELTDYELIYVDSNSSDDSIERAREFGNLKIFRITKKYNAAIARNIGAIEAVGEILCFLDGDLELNEEFLEKAEKFDFNKNILSGQSINYYYDSDGKFLKKTNEHLKVSDDNYTAPLTCGYFLIAQKIWQELNGMKPYFKNGHDPDLGLRLANKGYFMIRYKDIMVNHHTFSHRDKTKMWKDIFQKRKLYGTTLLIRENLLNRYTYKHIYKSEKSLVVLLISIILSFLNLWFFGLYIIAAGLRAHNHSDTFSTYINTFLNIMVRDVSNLLGFIFFGRTKRYLNRVTMQFNMRANL